MFAESLTVRILGDSSQLRRELESVLSQLDAFEQRVLAIANVGERLASVWGGLAKGIEPLQRVSQLLDRITQQLRVISQTPLTLNVQPAVASLLHLTAIIDAVTAKFRAVSAPPKTLPAGASASALIGEAAGAVAAGAAGFGAAAALSPAALNRQPVDALSLSSASLGAAASADARVLPGPASATTNHFGGITVNVRETADVNALVRDLRLQGIHLRNRRG
jgi:hypothetical protein